MIDWKIDLKMDSRSITGFVGLVNLGCTCYMNSLLQQFFSINSIRESILLAKEKDDKPQNSQFPINSSLLQLKHIFSGLKAYEGKAYNPKEFCLGFEGQPLSIVEQMDVDEFFNVLVDKLEPQLKGSKFDNPFRYELGGSSSTDIIGKDCSHRSEREEGFNCIILSMKSSIKESLESYINEELLEGDNAFLCEKCNKKVNAIRRTSLKSLPRTLILVLKRFEFDYDTSQKVKLNNYCEFPQDLNIKEFTQEYLNSLEIQNEENYSNILKNDDFYEYNLTGAIIHMGTAESGHYYSIIKNQNKPVPTYDKCDINPDWLEFNDSAVLPYDIEDLANDAFGGYDTIINKDNKKERVEKQSNAYVLFYKRKADEETLKKENSVYLNENIEKAIMRYREASDKERRSLHISEILIDKVNNDNFLYWVSKNLFSEEFIEFSCNLTANYNLTNYIKTIPHKSLNSNIFFKTNCEIINTCNKIVFYSMQRELPAFGDCQASWLIKNLEYNDVGESVTPSTESKVSKLALLCFFNLVIRSKDKSYIASYTEMIKVFINSSESYATYILEEFSHPDVLQEYLVDNQNPEMRNICAGIVYCAMIKIFNLITIPAFDEATTRYAKILLNTILSLGEVHPLLSIVNSIVNLIVSSNYSADQLPKDMTHVYMILWRFAQLGNDSENKYLKVVTKFYLVKIGIFDYLARYYSLKYVSQNCKQEEERKLKDLIVELAKNLAVSIKHKDLSSKLLNKVDKLTSIDEVIEKRNTEKLNMSRHESYLLMAFLEVYFIYLIDELKEIFDVETIAIMDLKNVAFLEIMMFELKNKASTVLLANLLAKYTLNDLKKCIIVFEAIKHVMNSSDYNELDFILRLLKLFMMIEDNIQQKRVNEGLDMLGVVFNENIKFYKFSEVFIDFIIKLFTSRKSFNNHHAAFKPLILKAVKWVKDNPYPPQLTPSKSCIMFKKRNHTFPNNLNTIVLNNFINRHTQISKEKESKLSEIYKSKS